MLVPGNSSVARMRSTQPEDPFGPSANMDVAIDFFGIHYLGSFPAIAQQAPAYQFGPERGRCTTLLAGELDVLHPYLEQPCGKLSRPVAVVDLIAGKDGKSIGPGF